MLKWHFKKLSCESIGRRWVHAFTVVKLPRQVVYQSDAFYNPKFKLLTSIFIKCKEKHCEANLYIY